MPLKKKTFYTISEGYVGDKHEIATINLSNNNNKKDGKIHEKTKV